MITFVKRPGAILEAGSLIARLTLDDPNQCRTFALYSGKFWNLMLIFVVAKYFPTPLVLKCDVKNEVLLNL